MITEAGPQASLSGDSPGDRSRGVWEEAGDDGRGLAGRGAASRDSSRPCVLRLRVERRAAVLRDLV